MKRRDLIRHLEKHGCEKEAVIRFMSIAPEEKRRQFRVIEKSTNFWRERFVRI